MYEKAVELSARRLMVEGMTLIKSLRRFDSCRAYSRKMEKNVTKMSASDRNRRIRSILERDGNNCHYCRKEMTEQERTLEHLQPRKCGGVNAMTNLVLACKPCNKRRGVQEYLTFRKGLMAPIPIVQTTVWDLVI